MNLDLDSQDFFITWCKNHNILPNETTILEKDNIIELLSKLNSCLINNHNVKDKQRNNRIKIIEKNNKTFIQIHTPKLLDFFYKKGITDDCIFVKSDKFIIKSFIIIHLYNPKSKSYKINYKKRKTGVLIAKKSNQIVNNDIFINDSD